MMKKTNENMSFTANSERGADRRELYKAFRDNTINKYMTEFVMTLIL